MKFTLLLICALGAAFAQPPGGFPPGGPPGGFGPGRGGPPGFGPGVTTKLVKDFDKDGDGRLDAAGFGFGHHEVCIPSKEPATIGLLAEHRLPLGP